MKEEKKKSSVIVLIIDLFKEIIVFLNLELNLAILEIKRNISSMGKGVVQMAIGAFLLLLALAVFICALIAVLALFLPLWGATLIVALVLTITGTSLLLVGKNRLIGSSPVPHKSFNRIKTVLDKLGNK